MNKIFTTPRGFPFDELTLQEIQDLSVPPINAISKLIPSNSIIWGCQLSNSIDVVSSLQRLPGYIIWNGELLPFVGGDNDTHFSIMEEVQQRQFNIGTEVDPILQDHDAYKRRWAQIGDIVGAQNVYPMTALKPSPRFLTYIRKGSIYFGTIVPAWIDIAIGGGTIINITFPNVGVTNYMIFSSFYSHAQAAQTDFSFDIFDKTATGFKLRLKMITGIINQLSFQYVLIPSDNQLVGTIGP